MQTSIFQNIEVEPARGKELAEKGLSVAVNNANKHFPGWSERCWDLFKRWISKKEKGYRFLMEEFREDCRKWKMIEEPPSLRSYGYITKRALKDELVIQSGTGKVENPKAHNANAAMLIKK